MQGRLSTAKETRNGHKAQIAELEASLELERIARPETVSRSGKEFSITSLLIVLPIQEERKAALSRLSTLKQELSILQKELSAYGTCDPAKVEEKKRAVTLAKEGSIRWTGEFLL